MFIDFIANILSQYINKYNDEIFYGRKWIECLWGHNAEIKKDRLPFFLQFTVITLL